MKKKNDKFSAKEVIDPDDFERSEIQQLVSRTHPGKVSSTEIIEKVDLELINHLSGIKSKIIKLNFKNTSDLISVRKEMRTIVQKNKTKEKVLSYSELLNPSSKLDFEDNILDIREDDIPYHVRVCIDNEIRCGCWYNILYNEEIGSIVTKLPNKLTKADIRVLAFDIETTKAPLKFPDPAIDNIIMISYMVDGHGFLIVNRQIISEEIEDFEYTPKPEFEGTFHVFNENDEKSLLLRFAEHCRELRVNVFVTFNGDDFDIPFILERMKSNKLNMENEFGLVGFSSISGGKDEFMGRFATHIDCLYWVRRDAFLPQGSHGLKAVTKSKLGYDPIEVDPEKMLQMAKDDPKKLCAYSVSDALATFYLYKLMIHDFIYALCTIIPTFPDEVLRKGSGTLCEELLMAQAFRRNILFPNKQVEEFEKFFKGHLINSETYIGGHVECLNEGVYRSDISVKFKLDPKAYFYLMDNIENYIRFCLEIENGIVIDESTIDPINIEEIKLQIITKLTALKDVIEDSHNNIIEEKPLIYHLDVSAMYPNIILTNRLQPVAIVDEQKCAGCIFNREENNCKRPLNWKWKGELFPLSRSEYENLKNQYEFELLNSADLKEDIVELTVEEHRVKFIKRIKDYCRNSYKQQNISKVELKEDIVCMRENSFYVDTVRDFRDRRYDFKNLVKVWKGKLDEAKQNKDFVKIEEAKNLMGLYESLQLAHKIILNSFYGYVMRKGARWHSMEMAAMVTHIGSNIITDSRELVERIGKPLELDTDGIWCLLPSGFPENFGIKLLNGKKINFSFPCTMLNHLIYEKYCNPQYQILDPNTNKYILRNEMSIFFEIDGPYRCMVIPAAKEEGKMLKKRYAVFSMGGKLHELKGFELKRRGELKIIKIFQSEVFEYFLKGTNLKECYHACGEIADRWYTILENKGNCVPDEELFDYIQESKIMSKSLSEYGTQKSTSITCAKRLAELIGNEIIKDKGLCAKYIISKKPLEAPVAERAIPTIVFMSDKAIKQKYLRKWLKDYEIDGNIDMRDVIDWDYYKDRLAGTILKILIIPALKQKIENPLPKIPCPDWVNKLMKNSNVEQRNLNYFYKNVSNIDKFINIANNHNSIKDKKVREIEGFEYNDDNIMNIDDTNKTIKSEENQNDLNSNIKNNKDNTIKNFVKKGKAKIEYENESSIKLAQNSQKNVPKEPEFEDQANMLENFEDWLTQQKQKWNYLEKKRDADLQSAKVSTNKNISTNTSNPFQKHMFPNHALNNKENLFKNSVLKIFQIQEVGLGQMKLWVSFGDYMETIYVNFKRHIYINSHKIDVPDIFKPVSLHLPRNKPLLNLYEFEIEEKEFKDKFNNFSDYLIDPTIEGVYETKVNMLFKAICEFGSQIKLKNKNRKISNNIATNSFLAEEFEIKPIINNDNYFNIDDFSKFYLYHSNCGVRHFIALINITMKKINLYIVNTIKNIEVNIKAILNNLIQNDPNMNNCIDFSFDISVTVETDVRVVFKNINKILLDLKNSGSIQPGIIMNHSCAKAQKLNSYGLTCLYTEFPVMEITFDPEENNYPALDWIKFSFKKMLYKFADVKIILDFRLLLSRYCNIPLCNITNDSYIDAIDLVFARSLKYEKQISWYSPSAFPDLGGGSDNHDFLGEVEQEFPRIIKPGMYMGYSCEIDIGLFCVNAILESDRMKDISGFYELKAIDNTNKDMRMRNKGTHVFDYHLERDEFVLGANAYVVMKKLIEKWLYDVKVHENFCADILLVHFYRWISSLNSKFYDPVLMRMMNKLMNKYFGILIKNLGDKNNFEIIYADYKKVFLYKRTCQDFISFQRDVEYLITTIKKIPLFSHITLSESNFYKAILFKDYFNFSAIQITSEEDVNLTTPLKINSKWIWAKFLPPFIEYDFISIINDYMAKLYKFSFLKDASMVMNLMNLYLSENMTLKQANEYIEQADSLKKFKEFLVMDYISYKIFDLIPTLLKKSKEIYLDDELEENFNEIKLHETKNETKEENEGKVFTRKDFEDSFDEDYYSDEDANNHKQIIKERFSTAKKNKSNDNINQNLKEDTNINKYNKTNHKSDYDDNENDNNINYAQFKKGEEEKERLWDFPDRLGSFQNFSNVALEYTKFISEVLAIDLDISDIAYKIKKNALKLMNIEEFSKETEFIDPCRTFILHDVVCELCSSNKDFDFCRDAAVLKNNWKCELCNTTFDRDYIEFLIIQKVRSFIDYYFNQDLKCKKCLMQKNEMIFTRCECAGEFVRTFEEDFFKKINGGNNNIKTMDEFVDVIYNIANYYRFDNLKAMIEQLKSYN